MKKVLIGIIIVALAGAAVYFGNTQLQKGSFRQLKPLIGTLPKQFSRERRVTSSRPPAAPACPGPYHVATADGRCVWSCSQGTTPDNATNECACQAGLVQTGTDQFGRRVCTSQPAEAAPEQAPPPPPPPAEPPPPPAEPPPPPAPVAYFNFSAHLGTTTADMAKFYARGTTTDWSVPDHETPSNVQMRLRIIATDGSVIFDQKSDSQWWSVAGSGTQQWFSNKIYHIYESGWLFGEPGPPLMDTPGTQYEFTVDPDNQITETNESDNVRIETVGANGKFAWQN